MRKHTYCTGFSLVELVVVMLIAGLVGVIASRWWVGFSRQNEVLKRDAILTQQLTLVGKMLAKDSRNAGYGVPGNGLDVVISDSRTDDQVSFYSNENQLQTVLIATVTGNATTVDVVDTTGAKVGSGICLTVNGVTRCRDIAAIAPLSGSQGRITVSSSFSSGVCNVGETNVSYAKRVSWYLTNQGSLKVLTRNDNGHLSPIGGYISNFKVVAVGAASDTLTMTTGFQAARLVYVAAGLSANNQYGPRPRIQVFEMQLRNYQ